MWKVGGGDRDGSSKEVTKLSMTENAREWIFSLTGWPVSSSDDNTGRRYSMSDELAVPSGLHNGRTGIG